MRQGGMRRRGSSAGWDAAREDAAPGEQRGVGCGDGDAARGRMRREGAGQKPLKLTLIDEPLGSDVPAAGSVLLTMKKSGSVSALVL
ncbi:MAG: hypothetical protein JWQ64_85 [Subtercola sp.]|nr:hypothetical protein [Subtercola sp.]